MRSTYVVYANPVKGQEAEFNRWYSETHIPEVLQIDGFYSVRRYRLNQAQVIGDQPFEYMAVYEIDGSRVDAVLANLNSAHQGFSQSNAFDWNRFHITVYDEIGGATAAADS